MHIDSIALVNFLAHDKSAITLPRTGIVLISGENGAGKSSFVEGVSFALEGKLLRGDVPWRGDAGKGSECTATMRSEGYEVKRVRKGRKTSLEWSRDGEEPTEYETTTKAQHALEQALLPFDVWRRSHVFSSSDATHFSIAGDADRKRLLESFLGYDHLEAALKTCRKDLRTAEDNLATKTARKEVLETKLAGIRRREEDAKQTLANLKDARETRDDEPPPARKDRSERIGKISSELREIVKTAQASASTSGEFEAEARHAKALLDKLSVDECPTCTQPIPPSLRNKLARIAERAKAESENAKEQARVELEALTKTTKAKTAKLEELKERTRREADAYQAWERRNAQNAREKRELENARAVLKETREGATEVLAALVGVEEEVDLLVAEVEELTAVEQVLGLKGVRAHILKRVLSGIELVANSYLSRLSPNASLSLSPYTDSGGESISLKVEGLGRGLGRGTYKSASNGERRRVDVALLLGVSEMSAGARGIDVGTIFFDEVFDGLDEVGIDGVLGILEELAETRAVVVITHRPELVLKLKPAAHSHVHVAEGQARVIT